MRARLNMSVRRFLDRIGIWKCWFLTEERGKPEYQEKNLSEQGREPNQRQTQSTYGVHARICTRGFRGGVLELIFAGFVLLASQSSYLIIVHPVANYRPHFSHFWAKCNFRDHFLFMYLPYIE